ncbi:hypothetical protein E4U43_007971 [Claviceps pusilla]|uniref:Uncharacterized protein n=1 Tax=Claviceps pusilla TaxID=123648 RepID=A0A9P7NDV9_9HYPO|nr:hypothetical protein E4U43_007971 [Claviceps pusilla]
MLNVSPQPHRSTQSGNNESLESKPAPIPAKSRHDVILLLCAYRGSSVQNQSAGFHHSNEKGGDDVTSSKLSSKQGSKTGHGHYGRIDANRDMALDRA